MAERQADSLSSGAGPGRLELWILLLATLLGLALSGVSPTDRATWMLEVAPVVIGLCLLIPTSRHFPLTQLAYRLLFLHGVVLLIGGHYTYAQVPAGFWVQEFFDLSRNHYDRFGHIAQGFVPAIVAREILIRRSPLAGSGWLFFLVTCVCLAFSAFYEMLEWWVAVGSADDAVAFLATQGDPWDTQWDMFLALAGAVGSQLLLAGQHDRQLARIRVLNGKRV
jgi:putative membrane protein